MITNNIQAERSGQSRRSRFRYRHGRSELQLWYGKLLGNRDGVRSRSVPVGKWLDLNRRSHQSIDRGSGAISISILDESELAGILD